MTNIDFMNFCIAALNKPVQYMWGTYGQPITQSLISAKARQYPTHYEPAYQAELKSVIGNGGIACDCTGLVKWCLWTGGNISKPPKYDGKTDNSASGWYSVAKVRGMISTMPERIGLILSYPGHCGVYIGDGNVIECTKSQFKNGVVQTKLSDRKWEKWSQCPYIEYLPNKGRCKTCGRTFGAE